MAENMQYLLDFQNILEIVGDCMSFFCSYSFFPLRVLKKLLTHYHYGLCVCLIYFYMFISRSVFEIPFNLSNVVPEPSGPLAQSNCPWISQDSQDVELTVCPWLTPESIQREKDRYQPQFLVLFREESGKSTLLETKL